MLSLNPILLHQVIARAKTAAAAEPRWLTAIDRAAVELEANPWIEAVDDHTLLISSASGEVYTSNGICQCKAYEFRQPCFHRAAARLYFRYVEAESKQEAATKATADINELF